MDFKHLLYNHDNQYKPEQGSLLIAEPLMLGDIFSRSVVMVLDEDDKFGHLGLVLNKKSHLLLNDLIPEWSLQRQIPVFSGGPVDPSRLFMLHTLGDKFEGSSEIIPGIYVGGQIEEIMEYIDDGGQLEGKMRFFLGYSGWTKGQLEGEISRNVWAVTDFKGMNSGDLLRGSGNAFWRHEVESLGNDYRSWLVVPPDPALN